MRRLLISSILVLAGLMASVITAQAFQLCWRLQDSATPPHPLLDFIRMGLAGPIDATAPSMYAVFVSQEAEPLYHAVGAGTATQDEEQPTRVRIGSNVNHTTTFFQGHRVCSLTLFITPIELPPSGSGNFTYPGTWEEQCGGLTGQNISGSLQYIACTASMASVQQGLTSGPTQPEMAARQLQTLGEYRAAGCNPEQPCLPVGSK